MTPVAAVVAAVKVRLPEDNVWTASCEASVMPAALLAPLAMLMSLPDSLVRIRPVLSLLSLAVMPVCEDTSLKAFTASASPAAELFDETLNVTLAAVLFSPLTARE